MYPLQPSGSLLQNKHEISSKLVFAKKLIIAARIHLDIIKFGSRVAPILLRLVFREREWCPVTNRLPLAYHPPLLFSCQCKFTQHVCSEREWQDFWHLDFISLPRRLIRHRVCPEVKTGALPCSSLRFKPFASSRCAAATHSASAKWLGRYDVKFYVVESFLRRYWERRRCASPLPFDLCCSQVRSHSVSLPAQEDALVRVILPAGF